MCEREDDKRSRRELEARYVNCFEAGFNTEEVVINLGQGYETESKVAFHTRIVTSPAYAKDLVELLQKTLGDYESAYGPIVRNRKATRPSAKPPTREDG
jgi:hypothetical protein